MSIRKCVSSALTFAAVAVLAGCVQQGPFVPGKTEVPAHILPDTMTSGAVRDLPRPANKVTVAVYEFPDMTGQNKPNSNFAEYSRAVTQGADAMLVDVLTEAGKGSWFNVVERRGLSNVLRERQLIQATRQQFQGDKAEPLPAMTFAGVLIEGGVVAYESNLRTGGVGARYLGIGGNTEYREDLVTVNLRLVSVNSGRVILSVTSSKQIYSTLVQASVFRYVSTDSLLEFDAGFTRNSPPQFALREAIELGVFALVMEGDEKGVWKFAHPAQAAKAKALYSKRSNRDASAETAVSRDVQDLLKPVPMAAVTPEAAGVDRVALRQDVAPGITLDPTAPGVRAASDFARRPGAASLTFAASPQEGAAVTTSGAGLTFDADRAKTADTAAASETVSGQAALPTDAVEDVGTQI